MCTRVYVIGLVGVYVDRYISVWVDRYVVVRDYKNTKLRKDLFHT